RDTWVRPAAEGERILTGALSEPFNREQTRPVTTAERTGSAWRLDGVKTCVPAATMADLILVPAATSNGARVFLVEPGATGVSVTAQKTTNKERYGMVQLEGVEVGDDALLGGPDGDPAALEWMVQRATIGLCALQLGATERALEATAEYSKTRVQFDRPIATFQAVGHRLADSYIDVEGIRLTLWQAAWRLSEKVPARQEIETAKFWAADGGHRVAHAAVHVHGGMGVATEYFVHRYFAHTKQLEFMLGGATEQALRIGAELAAEPV
ncbi:MAG: acyl-CoA dehydrogenase family protein, partial [Actinomycetota bacterium]